MTNPNTRAPLDQEAVGARRQVDDPGRVDGGATVAGEAPPDKAEDVHLLPGMTEAGIRAAIRQLEGLLPERALTVQQLIDAHMASLPEMLWVKSMKSTLKVFLAKYGGKQVSRFRPTDWDDYRALPEIRGHYSVTTRNIHLRRVKAAMNWGVATDRIPFNPITRVKREKGKPKRETEVTHDGEAAVLARLDPMMQAYVLLAVDGVMRREEVRLVQWDDIDWKTSTIMLHAARTKTKEKRLVRLTPRAMDALRVLPRWMGCPWVFANPETRKPYCGIRMWRLWRDAVDGAGLKPAPGDDSVRYHDLRATGASRLARLGAPIPAISKILGHKSIETTNLYIRVNAKDVEDAYALLVRSQRKGPKRAPPTERSAKLSRDRKKATG